MRKCRKCVLKEYCSLERQKEELCFEPKNEELKNKLKKVINWAKAITDTTLTIIL